MHIRPADYPQLKLIAWNRREDDLIDGEEALALYERNWRFVDEAALLPKERDLIERLVREFGNGVLIAHRSPWSWMQSERFLVIDFEATCCDRGTVPRDHMEIIEIGAVMVERQRDQFKVVDEFQSFVRPVRHPRLTAFCTALTSITQSDVSAAPRFVDAVALFKSWLYRYDGFVFCSWGDYDLNQLRQDCDFHRVPNPIGAPHVNLKRAFTEAQGLKKKPGLGEAIACAGLTFEGVHHRGIDDARNIARLLPLVFRAQEGTAVTAIRHFSGAKPLQTKT